MKRGRTRLSFSGVKASNRHVNSNSTTRSREMRPKMKKKQRDIENQAPRVPASVFEELGYLIDGILLPKKEA
jgi:hypothetical protein